MEVEYVSKVVEIHRKSFPGFFLTFLGSRFLSLYYSGICAAPEGIAYIYLDAAGVPAGFVAGTSDPRGFYSKLLRKDWMRFSMASLGAIFRRPSIVGRIARAVRHPSGNPAGIAAAVTERTKAILPVHFGGLPCDMDAILEIARGHGLKVVEDAAHALPASYRGRLVGALESDAAVFSFYATKTITTGEGGMIATKDPGIAERCRVMRLHGISRDAFDRYTSPKASWYYEVVAPGYKYNMTDLVASLGIHQLRKAHAFRARRAGLVGRYTEAFEHFPLILPSDAPMGESHAWHLYVIRLKETVEISRDRFIERMSEGGIGCSVHFIPLHLHPYWRDRYRLKPDDFPRTLDAYRRAVSLPLYTRMSEADQERVIAGVGSLLG